MVTFIALSIITTCVALKPVPTSTSDDLCTTQIDTLVTGDDATLTLAKYSFMQEAKNNAKQMYMLSVEQDASEMLTTFDAESAQYEQQVADLRERMVKLQEVKESRQEEEVDDSLTNLVNALEQLQNSIQSVSIEKTDAYIVTTGYESAGSEALVEGDRIDPTYSGTSVELTTENRYYVEHLVMGEAGNQGFIGAALVAQTIRDTMVDENCYDVLKIKKEHAYAGSLDYEPNEDVLNAVAFIFDRGGMAVQHRLIYFYAPELVSSDFHESQMFIVTYGSHKFFDRWN